MLFASLMSDITTTSRHFMHHLSTHTHTHTHKHFLFTPFTNSHKLSLTHTYTLSHSLSLHLSHTHPLSEPAHPPQRRRFFVVEKSSYPALASSYCSSNAAPGQGQLSSIRDSAELALLGSLKPSDMVNGMWVGAMRESPISSRFYWTDGWTGNSPNQYLCAGDLVNVERYENTEELFLGFWQSSLCIDKFGFNVKWVFFQRASILWMGWQYKVGWSNMYIFHQIPI